MSPTSSSRISEYLTVLKLPAFGRLWLSQLFALTAQNGIHLVQVVLIERLTGRSLHIGLMVAAFSLPPVIFSFLSSVVIDRVSKKWIIVISNLLRGCLAFSYIFVLKVLEGDALLVAVYAITFLGSSIGAFFNPAVLAKLPLVVGEKRLLVANSLFNLTVAGSQMLGLIVVAPVAVKVFGLQGSFALMGTLYFLAFLLVLKLPRDPARTVHGISASSRWQQMLSDFKEGWAFVVTHRSVLLAILQLTLVSSLLMILIVIGPGFSARVLGLAPEDAILVFTPAALGMLVAMVFLARYTRREPPVWLQAAMLVVTGMSFAIMAFISRDVSALNIPIFDLYPQRLLPVSTWVALAALPLGFGIYSVNTLAQTVVQHDTPAELRGRVFTVQFMLASLVGLIPTIIAASLADIIGIPLFLRWLAMACLVGGVISLYPLYLQIQQNRHKNTLE